MNNTHTMLLLLAASFAVLVLSTSCASIVPVTITDPGRFSNLSGVSKIAIVNFGSLPGDPATGIYTADAATCKLLQYMVASKFSKNKFYDVTDPGLECEIQRLTPEIGKKLKARFDAILVGRVWWQSPTEYTIQYPVVYRAMETHQYFQDVRKYYRQVYNSQTNTYHYDLSRQYTETSRADLTVRRTDQLALHFYRASGANLIASLTLYRLDSNGHIEKIVENAANAGVNYVIDNGIFSMGSFEIGKIEDRFQNRLKDISEKKESRPVAIQDAIKSQSKISNTHTIPTALEMKMVLAAHLSEQLTAPLTPHDVIFKIPYYCWNDVIENLMQRGAFEAVRAYIGFAARKKFGSAVIEKIPPLASEKIKPPVVVEPEKPLPVTPENIASVSKSLVSNLEILALAQEASGDFEIAYYTYEFLFDIAPSDETAAGLSRCLYVNNVLASKLKKKNRELLDAEHAASLRN